MACDPHVVDRYEPFESRSGKSGAFMLRLILARLVKPGKLRNNELIHSHRLDPFAPSRNDDEDETMSRVLDTSRIARLVLLGATALGVAGFPLLLLAPSMARPITNFDAVAQDPYGQAEPEF